MATQQTPVILSKTALSHDQLKNHAIYDVIIHGTHEEDEKFEQQTIVLDRDADSILVLNADWFNRKDLKDLNDVYKLTLKSVAKDGCTDEQDDYVMVYDIINGHIETCLGFPVEFVVEAI